MTTQALPYVVLLGTLFGSTLIASRFGLGQFDAITYIGLRAVIASICYGAVYIFNRNRPWPTGSQLWRRTVLLGIFGTAVPMVGVVSSLQYLSSGVVAILISAGPALTILMAHFFLPDERLNIQKGIGITLALTGALLITLRGESGLGSGDQANPIGYALILMALVAGNAMNIYARKYMRDFDTVDVASIRMWITTLIIMPFVILFVGIDLSAVTAQGYFVLFYAGIVANFLGMFLAFYNVKRFGATAAAMTDYVIPVVAALGGVLVLDEQITIGMAIGMLFIAIGLMLINRFRQAAPKPV